MMSGMVLWQRIEGAGVFAAALWAYVHFGAVFGLWLSLALFLAPDLSFAAYAAGPRAGALGYNLLHLYALGAGILALGLGLGLPMVTGLGLLWVAHAGFDRMMGYGLKGASFADTHLGRIGRG